MYVCEQIKFRRGLPPGDGVLFYPGEVFSSSCQPVASVRLERILSGLQVRFIRHDFILNWFANVYPFQFIFDVFISE